MLVSQIKNAIALAAEYKNHKQKDKKGKAGYMHQRQAKRKLQDVALLAIDKRKGGEADCGNRCEEGWLWEAFLGRTWLLAVHFSTESRDGNTKSQER